MMPPTSRAPKGWTSPWINPVKPSRTPIASYPCAIAERTTARIAALIPGASPPLVNTANRCNDTLPATRIDDAASAVFDAGLLGGPRQFPLGLGHNSAGRHEAIRIQRDGIDTRLDQECRELGIVAGRLPAYSHLDAATMRTLDDIGDHALDGRIALVEQSGQFRRIPVHPQYQLRQIIAADGEP